jgi:urease accessory protein
MLLVAAPHEASAHTIAQGSDAFTSGALHPISLPSHLLNLVGLGLLIGQQDARKLLVLPLLFLAVLSGLGATARIYESPTEIWLPVSAGVLGVLVAGAWTLPRGVTGLIVVTIGIMLGLDSRPETPFLSDALRMFGGTALTAGGIASVVAIIASLSKQHWQEIGIRIAGSWIAATAILVSALQFSR